MTVEEAPSHLKERIRRKYGHTISFCLVIYKRKSLLHYAKRMNDVDETIFDSRVDTKQKGLTPKEKGLTPGDQVSSQKQQWCQRVSKMSQRCLLQLSCKDS